MKKQTKMLVSSGMLTAVQIILSRFCSINAWNIKIGLGFIPLAVAGMLFGSTAAGLVGAASDFLGAILFPIGPYFPGFTLTAFFTGIVYGVLLHNPEQRTGKRIFVAVVIIQIIGSLLLNSFWISVLYHSPYIPLILSRMGQCVILGPIEFIIIHFLARAVHVYERSVLT